MNTLKKMAGFFIVEILVVLVIVGILVAALLPNLTIYTQRHQSGSRRLLTSKCRYFFKLYARHNRRFRNSSKPNR